MCTNEKRGAFGGKETMIVVNEDIRNHSGSLVEQGSSILSERVFFFPNNSLFLNNYERKQCNPIFSFAEMRTIITSGHSNIDSYTIYPQLGWKI